VLARLGDGEVSPEAAETLVAAVSEELDTDDEAPFWRLVDRVAKLRELSDREQRLVADILEVVAAHAGRGRR
jgi:hypothetical protein